MKHSERLELFEKVRAEYAELLSGVLWKLTGDKELFEEAMQNALLIMWKNVEKLEGDEKTGYLYRIALTANSQAWRKRTGKHGELPENDITESENKDTGEMLDNVEMVKKVRKAITKLSPNQGKTIIMRYFEHQDYDYIAKKLNCTNSGARSHVSKAIVSLKQKLAHLNEFEAKNAL